MVARSKFWEDPFLPQFISVSKSNSLNVLNLRSLRPHLPGPSVMDRPIYIISTSNSDSWGSEPSNGSTSMRTFMGQRPGSFQSQ